MSSGTQPKLPISVAPDLVLEAVEAVEDTIYYSYETIDNVHTDFDAPSFADAMKSSRLPVICEKMSDLLEAGVSFVSLFDDKDNHRIAAFSVASDDCSKGPVVASISPSPSRSDAQLSR